MDMKSAAWGPKITRMRPSSWPSQRSCRASERTSAARPASGSSGVGSPGFHPACTHSSRRAKLRSLMESQTTPRLPRSTWLTTSRSMSRV